MESLGWALSWIKRDDNLTHRTELNIVPVWIFIFWNKIWNLECLLPQNPISWTAIEILKDENNNFNNN